jgi:hypothetical protein
MGLKISGKEKPRSLDFRQVPYDVNLKPLIKEMFPSTYQKLRGMKRHGGTKQSLMAKLHAYGNRYVPLSVLRSSRNAWALSYALSKARKDFTIGSKVEPLPWRQVRLEGDKSSGWPYYKKKREVMEQTFSDARALAHYMKRKDVPAHKVPWHKVSMFKRSHVSDISDEKIRLVWGYPAAMTWIEGKFAQPLIEAYSQNETPVAMGGHTPSKLSMMVSSVNGNENEAFNLDFSGFDATVPPWLIRAAFDILKRQIRFDEWQGHPVNKPTQGKWARVWDKMVWFFINTVIVGVNGVMYRKDTGIPSGSYFTSIVGSICNYIAINVCILLTVGKTGVPKIHKVLGDDSWFILPWRLSIRVKLLAWSFLLKKYFGMILSPSENEGGKSQRGRPENVKFLGYMYRFGYPYREDYDIFKTLLYPESNSRSPADTWARLLGVYISSAGTSFALEQLIGEFSKKFGYLVGAPNNKLARYLKLVYGIADINVMLRARTLNFARVMCLN